MVTEQLIPLVESGLLLGIYRQIGKLRDDTNKNSSRIDKNDSRIERLMAWKERRTNTSDVSANTSAD